VYSVADKYDASEFSLFYPDLLPIVLQQCEVSPAGIHGVDHWARVLENGLILSTQTGADRRIIELFAMFHDSKRMNDGPDLAHGFRGALFAQSLRGRYFELNDKDFHMLFEACRDHTMGHTKANITVQTCWDADRLDLARVGVVPNPKYLCTDAAKVSSLVTWATLRSLDRVMPVTLKKYGWSCPSTRNAQIELVSG